MWILESGATRFAGSMPKGPCFAHETMSSVSRRASFSNISTVVFSPSAEAGRRPAEAGGGKSRAMRPAEASGSSPEVRGSQTCFQERLTLATVPSSGLQSRPHTCRTVCTNRQYFRCRIVLDPWAPGGLHAFPGNSLPGARNEPPHAPGQPRLSHERAPREFPYGRRHSTP